MLTASPLFHASLVQASNQISFKAVYGLWIILAAGMGLGAGIMFANRWQVKRRRRQLKAMTVGHRAAAEPSLMDLVFTPQKSLKPQRDGHKDGHTHTHVPVSDLVEASDGESSEEEEDAPQA